MPALIVPAVLYVLPQSEMTKPLKPQRFLRVSVSRNGFSAHHWPFTLL